ncbi:MAG: TetR family transcriptional regulator [Spirochaetes bacterium]|jgi:AcrR family transcriptional regulator|nr:TetR family transcriptional regulator [Spirochaetota bacterium]
MKHFAESGYRDVSVSDIMLEAGLSVGSFYNYFTSKEEFYGRVLDVIESEGIRKIDRVVMRLRSPINKLKAVYRFTTLGLKQNRILRGVLRRDQRYVYPGLAEREQQTGTLRNHVEELLREIIREGTAKNVFRTGLYRDPARLIIAIFDTIVYQIDRDDIDSLLSDMLVFLQRGLRRTLRLRRRDERYDRKVLDVDNEL